MTHQTEPAGSNIQQGSDAGPAPLHPHHDVIWRELKTRYALKARECYRNAFDTIAVVAAILKVPLEELYYVEGWVAPDNFPAMTNTHGWLEHKGEVIDPTYQDNATRHQYFPAARLTFDELYAALEANPSLPVFAHDGAGGWTSLAFVRSHLAAQRWSTRDWEETERTAYETMALSHVLSLIQRLESGEHLTKSERRLWTLNTR